MSRLYRFLNVNEKVLWSGKPQRKNFVLQAFIFSALMGIPFGLGFLAFYFFFFWSAFPTENPYFTILGLPLPLLIIGLAAAILLLWQLLRFRNT
jgi:hypothetical protein